MPSKYDLDIWLEISKNIEKNLLDEKKFKLDVEETDRHQNIEIENIKTENKKLEEKINELEKKLDDFIKLKKENIL